MKLKQIASMNTWDDGGNPECPFDCVGCEHLKGINFHSCEDVDIECDLEE